MINIQKQPLQKDRVTMKRESSLTALGNAAFRALESEKKQNRKICDDPYARKFIPTWLHCIAKSTLVTGYAE
jgi:O-methyltransferase involved in polyketide biosynthesis